MNGSRSLVTVNKYSGILPGHLDTGTDGVWKDRGSHQPAPTAVKTLYASIFTRCSTR